MGCQNGKAQAFNDIYEFEPGDDESKWTLISAVNPPAARARHAAFALDDENLLIFGGVNKRDRYDDLCVYNCPSKTWSNVQAQGYSHVSESGVTAVIRPGPRAHFTAAKATNQIFIFGGYGGAGIVYGDLWVLHVEVGGEADFSFRWEFLELEGKSPDPRMDHSVLMYPVQPSSDIPEKMVIMGGRDLQQYFEDVHVLDLGPDTGIMRWTDEEAPPPFSSAVCNSCCDAIESVPYHKVFTFGGKTGPMECVDGVDVLDTGTGKWSSPSIIPHPRPEMVCSPPIAREDCAWVYDSRRSAITLFGGWSSRWLGDTWRLHAAAVIGPPYACIGIEPGIGPVFGSTDVEIRGLRFRDGNIQVKFTAGKNEAIAEGVFVDSTRIHAKTPNFEAFGPQQVDIVVQISGEGWTVQKQTFSYFANTTGRNSLAYGPGLLPKCVHGVETSFRIQAYDTAGEKRQSGGDRFSCTIAMAARPEITGRVLLEDHGTGQYTCTFSVPLPGDYDVAVVHADLGSEAQSHVRGSPFRVHAADPWTRHRVLGTAPSARKGSSLLPVAESLVLFGGDKTAPVTLSTDSVDWRWAALPLAEGAPEPPPRASHGAALWGEDAMVIFAGMGLGDQSELNDVWVLRCVGDKWAWDGGVDGEPFARQLKRQKLLDDTRPPEPKPVPADAPHLALVSGDADKLWLHGHRWYCSDEFAVELVGAEADRVKEVKFFLNTSASDEGAEPVHVATEAPFMMGTGEDGEPKAWKFEAGEVTISAEIIPASGDDEQVEAEVGPPTGRTAPLAVIFNSQLITFGGESAGEAIDELAIADLSSFPGTSLPWNEPSVQGGYAAVPAARKGMAGVRKGGVIYLYAGLTFDEDEGYSASAEMFSLSVTESGVEFASVEQHGSFLPEPRAAATMRDFDKDSILMLGGTAADGKPMFDAWMFNVTTCVWTCVFNGHPELAQPAGVMSVLADGRLAAVNATPGTTKLDICASLNFADVKAEQEFTCKMKATGMEILEGLQRWVQEQKVGLEHPIDEVKADFKKLLETMAALYRLRTAGGAQELLVDQLADLFTDLVTQKVFSRKQVDALEGVRMQLEELKNAAPEVREAVAAVQEVEGKRIRNEIQAFTDSVNAHARVFRKCTFLSFATGVEDSYLAMDEEGKVLEGYREQLAQQSELANTFDFPEATTEARARIENVFEELSMAKDVWDTVSLCDKQFEVWKKTLWNDIDTDVMEDASKAFVKEVRSINKGIRDEDCYKGLDAMVKAFTTSLPLVAELRSPTMRTRHWDALMAATKKEIRLEDPTFSLQHLLDLELHKFEEEVGEIVDQAQKEEKMETALARLGETWAKMEFQFLQHGQTEVHTVKMVEEDFEALEDDQVLLQGMIANRFCVAFADPDSVGCEGTEKLKGKTPGIMGWNKRLNGVADNYQLLNEIQRTWAYLESLFIHSDEVKKELPEATKRFERIDIAVKEILKSFRQLKNCVAACNQDGLFKQLEEQQSELEVCEKALAEFKESKRRAFPRFYFVSSNDLLDILSNGNNPQRVMTHLSKCFQAIDRLILDESGARPKGCGIVSCVGIESCQWTSPLLLDGKVEQYMNGIIDKMRSELKSVLLNSVKAYPAKKRTEWLFDWPSQVILVVNQIYWCQEVEEAFAKMSSDKDAMKTYNQQQVQQLTDLIQVTRTDLEKCDRQKVMNMITIDAHSRDMIEQVAESGSDDVESFQWVCQLRTYWDKSIDDCRVRICDASFPYGYEYLGNGPRLVITPLTDRIYITATQACWLCLGTAPAGPAGTGKTETTKDLSAQLGKSIYVFNCAPEMDYRTMGDIFKGLAASGSWGCFDEFNRLVPEVLSVCSVQYKCVTDSQKKKSLLPGRGLDYTDASGKAVPAITDWRFIAADGVEMPLEEGTSAFITMNPGYIGRAELPESLKALFRPITVVVPDRQLIMENMLMAEGFETAKVLAKKFAALYYLLEDLLSPQKHYDWGLRAIKSVLVVAGSLLRAEAGQDEADVLFRALRDFNIPKILLQDLVIFSGLLSDLFPSTDPPRKRDQKFEEVIVEETKKAGLTPEDDFVLRVVQFSELLAIRHCVFLMGPTGSGRTEVYRVLAKALMKGTDDPVNDYLKMVNRQKITIKDINPKAVSTQELYGYVNMATREWKDGLLSYYMRELSNIPDENPKWILLDGDLDANWIESMNSVMDDNKLLTLPSNERIRLLPHMKLVFEIRDLKFATPATATRAGILYVSEGQQWSNMVHSWIARVMPEYAAKAKWKDPTQPGKWVTELVEKYCPTAIFEMKKAYDHITPLNTMNFVTSLTNVLEGCLMLDGAITNKADAALFEMLFVFAMVWAFGGGLNEKDGINYRRNFDKWFKQTFTAVKFPGKGTVFDYYINFKTGKFAPWSELVMDAEFDSQTMTMGSMFVSTPETASVRYFLDMMIALRKPIMFVGGAGVGKTQLVKGKLAGLSEEQLSLTISFNYFTDVITFQRVLESALEKKAGVKYGPPGTKQLLYFIDDLNMPKLDPYDTAMPISLIRQHLGWGHWYDRVKLSLKEISNTQYIAAMNPTAGSFIVNPRLQRLFMTLAMDFPGQDSLMQIYGTFLAGHFKHFKADIQEMQTKILQAALALHEGVVGTFRKTAINFHYEFTIRHLANVFQGLLMSAPEQFTDTTKMARLWLHESERVYADRLVSAGDLDMYNKKAAQIAKKYFSIPDIDDYYKKTDPKPLIFCHFAQGLGEKNYNEVESYTGLYKTLIEALNEYNETNAVMDLVLFEDAMKHICRISRIISNPSGHALLVGVGGSGKQSLARLAAHICGFVTMMIVISGSYGLNAFKEDLQKMYRKAGQKGEGVMFLFTDSQVVDEKMLVFINDLLSSGEIPDLFPVEDRDDIINAMRAETKASGLLDTNENCWATFIRKVKENLHMVFTASPVGDNFRVRSQRFLATINSTVIDWFQPWPEASLLSVAERFLKDVDLGDDSVRQGVVEFMPHSFAVVNAASTKFKDVERRFNYTTPKTFLELIKLYKGVLGRKRKATTDNIDRLETGLTKLQKTKKDVDVLVEEAKRMAVQVQEKVRDADAFAEKVGEEKVKVNAENEAAQIEKEKCEQIAVEVTEKQLSCEKDLAAALPLVEQAEAALDTLNKKDLGEAKSLKKPPAGVDDVTAVVIILLEGNPKDKSWAAAQKLMNNVDKFLERLKTFKNIIDDGGVTRKVVEATRSYLELPHFNRDVIQNKSKAAAGLCDWAINIVKYFDVVIDVAPKKAELAEANAKLADANETLEVVMSKVAELNKMVADLESQFEAANKDKNDAIAEQERCDLKLSLANRLITALSSEGERWAATVEQLKGDYDVLTGDMLFASAFVSYAGPFTASFRTDLNDQFLSFMKSKGTPMTAGLSDPLKVLVDEALVASWVKEGLPSDPTSVQNGTILNNSERWPLIMDPQLQGIVWIKEREAKNDLKVVRMEDDKKITVIERAIEAGSSVLIENMGESIDAVLNPIITRSTFKKGRSLYVKLGDKDVEYNPKFRLVLHTKLSNPHYPPEIQAETTLINFTVTENGLEDQLLALAVNKERPDLEATKTALVKQNTEFTIRLKQLEDDLLMRLSTAEGDLTEDVALIESLEESKRIADDISAKVAEAKETEKMIMVARNRYRDVAARGAMLFFLLNSLNKIHAFYQFSLNAFVAVFARGIDNAPFGRKKKGTLVEEATDGDGAAAEAPAEDGEPAAPPAEGEAAGEPVKEEEDEEEDYTMSPEDLERRLVALTECATFTVFDFTRRGLFDRDKLIITSLLTFTILLRNKMIDALEYSALVEGKKNPTPQPAPNDLSRWIAEGQWGALDSLCSTVPAFNNMAKEMDKNSDDWEKYCGHERPEDAKMPGEWGKPGTARDAEVKRRFRELLIIRALRPDRITNALNKFCAFVMGTEYVNQPAFTFEAMMPESTFQTPLFFILFPGYSPSKDLEKYANKVGYSVDAGNLTLISMGQGQEKPAEATLDKYMQEGGWVFLDNVHLMQGWVPRLERKLEIAAETAHKDFRCFFSAEPINGAPFAKIIPESILQVSIKVANEPPSDMKSNMLRSFGAFDESLQERLTTEKKRSCFRSIMFGLCFYHSLLLGRKKFGVGIGVGAGSGLGFCRGYSFNMGDLCTCGDVLINYLNTYEEVPWADLRYMFGEVFYGGHITDNMDRRCCTTYLDVLIIPELLPTGDINNPSSWEQPIIELSPGFHPPVPTDFASIAEYIGSSLPSESPIVYGMHPNAELSLLTAEGETLFRTIFNVASGGGGGGAGGGEDRVRTELERYMEALPEPFSMVEIEARVVDKTPYVVVALQEAGRMNVLLGEMKRSMEELTLGLDGSLNMSAAMEALAAGIRSNSVPARWMAQMSSRIQEVYTMAAWFADVVKRHAQLEAWTAGTVVTPLCVWLPGLFNPKAFVTAVMQTYARTNGLPLDVMRFMTDVTDMTSAEEVTEDGGESKFIHGVVLEGARWDAETGALAESNPNELHPSLPVLRVRPVVIDNYSLDGYYPCPVYVNMQRANVYSAIVSMFTLKTAHPISKWVLASVALLLQDELA